MRRLRPFPLYWSAILAVVLGAVAVPATALADGEDAAPTEGTVPQADPAPAAPRPPAPSEAGSDDGDDAPAPPTTAEPGDEPAAPESPDTPAPETTSPATDPAPVPSTLPQTQAGPAASESPTIAAPPVEPSSGDELEQDAFASYPDGIVRPIAFPVLGPVRYGNGWGNCRDGCARRHVGTDMIGVRMQPLLAAVDGTITRIRYENEGTAGVVITITGADGWYYNYFHVNNDTAGTDDGAAGPAWQVPPQLIVGSPVRAGQVIGYMGDSGNAEGSVPHLHFEIRQPDRTPVNPYPSLVAAEHGPTCDEAATWRDPSAVAPDAVAIIPLDNGGRWLIDRQGHLFAEGSADATPSGSAISCTPTELIPPAVDVPVPATETIAPEALVPSAEGTPLPQPVAEPAPVPQPTAESTPVATPVIEPAPEPPASTSWTVERGQSLWQIAQEAYAVSDVASTVSLVELIFEHNRAYLTDPDDLTVGTDLLLPAI